MTIAEAVREIEQRLLAEGVIIQRYNAYTTGSVYLKLDYGIANSIRISDHIGKNHLSYMFNIGSDIKSIRTVKDEFTRYYYPITAIDEAVQHILRHRKRKMMQFNNMSGYELAMHGAKELHQDSKGFWSRSYLVNMKKSKKRKSKRKRKVK